MGEGSSEAAKKSLGERWKFGVDLINANVTLLRTFALIGLAIIGGWAALSDSHSPGAWLKRTFSGFSGDDEGGRRAQARRVSSAPTGPVYVNIPAADPRFGASLLQNFHAKGIQVTDNPAQSAATLEVATDVTLQAGHTFGSTIWQAVATSSLKALDTKSRATLLWTTFEGHGTATQPNLARRYAIDDAASHLVAEYQAFAQRAAAK